MLFTQRQPSVIAFLGLRDSLIYAHGRPCMHFLSHSCYQTRNMAFASCHSLIYLFPNSSHPPLLHSLVRLHTYEALTKHSPCGYTKRSEVWSLPGTRLKNCRDFGQWSLPFHRAVAFLSLFLFASSSMEFLLELRDQSRTRCWVWAPCTSVTGRGSREPVLGTSLPNGKQVQNIPQTTPVQSQQAESHDSFQAEGGEPKSQGQANVSCRVCNSRK